MLNSIETTVGTLPFLSIWSGSPPAATTDAPTGTPLAPLPLPSDWMSNAASGTKEKTGTWQVVATGGGTAGYFRVYDNPGTTCHIQGTVTATGGGGDITLDNTSILAGQTVTITSFALSAGNA